MNIITMFVKPNPFEEEILAIMEELKYHEKDSKEYAQILNQLEKVVKAEEMRNTYRRLKPDTMAQIAANLAGIGLILNFEKIGVITTKALGFVIKGRV